MLFRSPVLLYRKVLAKSGFAETELVAIEDEVSGLMTQAIRFAEESALPDPATLYEYLYSQPINPTPNCQ